MVGVIARRWGRWGAAPGGSQPEPVHRPCSMHPQSPDGDSSLLTEGAFWVGCSPTAIPTPTREPLAWLSTSKTPTPKASFPSGGGSWHVVPDGRGICKAKGTVVLSRGGSQADTGIPPRSKHPQSPDGDSSLLTEGAFLLAVPKENSQPIRLLPPAGEEAGTQCLMVGVFARRGGR